jgi:NodT family efflux transporter outer membrane factor (OMF) lipoprotein
MLAALLTSCAVGPSYHAPQLGVPEHYATAPPANAAPTATPVELESWWRALNDPELNSLIERAVQANPDIDIALQRLQAARAYEAGLIGTLLPEVQASGGAGWGTGSDLARGRASQTLISADDTSGLKHISAVAGFDAVWELDIWGKYRREIEAAHADAQASAAARNQVLVGVIADVARAYVDLRALQMQSSVLDAALDTLRESLRIVRIRYERGITNELDVTLATRELASLEAQLAPVQSRISAAQYTLATLLGQYPEALVPELTAKAMIPSVPGETAAGLPLELLRRRPDVVQAERELASATARIGVATADLFPHLAVTGAVGYQRQGLGTVPEVGQHIWSAGPALAWSLLDFGALDAQVEIADLQTRALLVNYKKTLQDAVRDVDTTLSAYAAEQVRLGKLGEALIASQRAVTLASERYERGLTDFLNVVDAERQEYDIEEQYTDAQAATAAQFIALYRALGGGWQNYQQLPPIHIPEPAIIAAFHRVLVHEDPLKQ